jgi:hypothetical protein
MTLRITNVKSAYVRADDTVAFTVDCGDILDVETVIQSGEKNTYNNAMLQAWLDENTPAPYVDTRSAEQLAAEVKNERRDKRAKVFATTLDLVNGLWYSALNQLDKDALAAWRQAWLDYPDTGVEPSDNTIAHIFGMDDGS